jgi:adenylate kinase
MKIMVAGLPGSGKTTQAEMLSTNLNIPYVSMGAILREDAAKDTDTGRRVREAVSNGELLDNELTAKILEEKLKGEEFKEGFIVDGYPRDVEQLNFFDPKYDRVFYLNVSLEEGLKRLLNRQRSDDIPEVIKRRQEVQQARLDELLGHLKTYYKFVELDGEMGIDEIHQQIIKQIGGK